MENAMKIMQQVETSDDCPDPIELYEKICSSSQDESALFISTHPEDRQYRYSLIARKMAIRLQYHHPILEINALSPTGKQLMKALLGVEQGYQKINYEYSADNICSEEERLKQKSPFDTIRQILKFFKASSDLPSETQRLLFIFSFELITFFEKMPPLPHDPLNFPDFTVYLPEELVVINHLQKQTHYSIIGPRRLTREQILATFRGSSSPTLSLKRNHHSCTVDVTPSEALFQQKIEKCKQHIFNGDIYQTVISRRFSVPCYSPYNAFKHLIQSNLSEYAFYFKGAQHIVFGASPETCLKIEKGILPDQRLISLYPIAGTRPRAYKDGKLDIEKDLREEAMLRLSQKELAEHMMLVDLARNDISRVSIPGSTQVKELATIKRYSKVMHMSSMVQGILKEEWDPLHAYTACMNMGTLCGAPKIKATEILRECEQTKRGAYGGAIGWLNSEKEMDCAIIIRSAIVHQDLAYVQAGAGIVADSCPIEETLETEYKAQAIINAILAEEKPC